MIVCCLALSDCAAQQWGIQQPGAQHQQQVPQQAPQPSGEVAPIYWGSYGLAIPYRWAGQTSNQSATVVELYVSQNRGANWQKVASAAPQVHSFKYQAASDGEYWFAIRTYDRSGNYQPVGPLRTEMRVLVDTTSPLNPRVTTQLQNGVLVAQIQVSDRGGIDTQSLRLYAQLPNQPSWTPIPLEPLQAGQSTTTGRWRLPAGATQVALRASVADLAGNRSETNSQVSAVPAFGQQPLIAQQPILQQPILQQHSPRPYQSAGQQQNNFASLPLSGPQNNQWQSATTPPVKDPFLSVSNSTPAYGGQQTQRQTVSLAPPTNGWAPQSNSVASAAPSSPSQPWPVDAAPTKRFTAQPTQRPSSLASTNRPTASPFQSASFGTLQTSRSLDAKSLPSNTTSAPISNPTALSRSVNSTNFEFDYELDQAGQWGVASVELWGTADGGNSWRRFAIDSDRLSPIHVSVPSEGDYGFRILVESVGGFEPTPPRPGDQPEVTVRVDQTAPRLLLQRAEQGQGYQADRLNIQWSMTEEHPVDRPIDLYYSNRKSGPWIPLATSIDNSGRYAWRIQRHLPEQLYLKIEARDQAGNIGSAVSNEMIAIRVPQASGSLRAVRTAPGRGY